MSTHHTLGEQAAIAASATVKNGPPVAASGAIFWGVPLSDVVLYATLIWICVQLAGYLWDRFGRKRRGKRDDS